MRFVNLASDPPGNIDWSRGLYTDEAFKSWTARDRALEGQWFPIDVDKKWFEAANFTQFFYISPLWTWLCRACFGIFGVSFVNLRILSILLTFGALLLLYRTLERELDWPSAMIAASLLGISYMWVMFNRLAILSTEVSAFLVCTFCFLALARPKRIYFAVAGLFLFLSFLMKASIVGIVPAIMIAWVYLIVQRKQLKMTGRQVGGNLGLFLGGFVVPFLIWFAAFVVPRMPSYLYNLNKVTFNQAGLGEPILQILSRLLFAGASARFFALTPIVSVAVVFATVASVVWLFSKPRRFGFVEAFALAWFWGQGVFVGMVKYRPERYFVDVLPPAAILISIFLLRMFRGEVPQVAGVRRRVAAAVICFVLLFYLDISIGARVARWSSVAQFLMASWELPLVGAVVVGLPLDWLKRRWAQTGLKVAAVLAIIAIVSLDSAKFVKWAANPAYSMADESKRFAQIVGKGRVGGAWAMPLSFGYKDIEAFPIFDWDIKQSGVNPFDQAKPTHLLLEAGCGWDDVFLKKTYPKEMSEFDLVGNFVIGEKYGLQLYRRRTTPSGG
jgi:4-amino-4-deoxy-L-arabinose transferase-like glycosyltransferase